MESPSYSRHSSVTLVLSALVSVSIASYFYYQQKSQQPRNSLHDLQGNFYATGTDVCRLYGDKVPTLVVLVTGTSSGLGAQTARLLGTNGAFVILGNRRPTHPQTSALVKEIEHAGGRTLSLQLDLASFASVQRFAREVQRVLKEEDKKLNVLIHNAGVSFLNGSTENGYQKVWQVNALAPSLLTELLLPFVCTSDGRVVLISSEMHRVCFGKSVVDQCPPPKERGKSAFDYALSKACQILLANELNNREGNSVRSFAIEPGLVRTNIGRHTSQLFLEMEYFLFGPFFLRTVDQGCSSTMLCALAPLSDLGGKSSSLSYYFANCLPKNPKANTANLQEAKRLKQLCHSIWKSYLY